MVYLRSIIAALCIGSAFASPVKRQSAPQNATATYQNTSSTPVNVPSSHNTEIIQKLLLAATAAERFNILPNAEDHVYDFNNPPNSKAITSGAGGHTVRADRTDFPALIGNGVSMTVGFIGPCGFNTPHTHPRSAEINIIVEGSLGTEYISENGASLLSNTLTKYQMTVFPQGSIHTEFNPDCSPAVFVAGFASEDPGVQQSAQRLFDLSDDVLKAEFNSDFTFAGEDIDAFRSKIPANVALGVEACLAKCGIQKR